MSSPRSEHWIIHSRSNLAAPDPERFEVGDAVELSAGSPEAPAHLRITREKVEKLDVSVNANGDEFRFDRRSGRGARQPDWDKFRGEIRRIALGATEVLVAVIGYKSSDGTGDDDDTEVVVASRPPTPADG